MDSARRRYEGKTALVTGGAQGIGRAIALRLATEGASVVVADVNLDGASGVAEEIAAAGGTAHAVLVDVTSVASIEAMTRAAVEQLGRIDVLVCNAGLIRPGPFGAVTEADWDITFAVNARGLFFTMQAAAPHIPDGGAIVTIGSIAGRGTPTNSPPYAASKAAVINVTQTTARALAPRRVRVNAICPGAVDTEFQARLDREWGQARQGLPAGELKRRWEAGNPLGRYGRPDEIAAAVAYVASDEAGLMTGQAINIDGGTVIF